MTRYIRAASIIYAWWSAHIFLLAVDEFLEISQDRIVDDVRCALERVCFRPLPCEVEVGALNLMTQGSRNKRHQSQSERMYDFVGEAPAPPPHSGLKGMPGKKNLK